MGIRNYVARRLLNVTAGTAFKMITETGNGFAAWTGDVYDSDIVRACIRPFSKAVGKLQAKHVRRYNGKVDVNPEPYMRFLLEEPNPYMADIRC